jgi:tRNA 2-thiouridine synthesizing protein E
MVLEGKTVNFDGREYTLDSQGFLDPPSQWDECFARGMANDSGIFEGLSEEHWSFIGYLRKKFVEEKTVPLVVNACVDNGLRLTKLRQMFPLGYHRGACRIAGLNYAFMATSNIWITYENYTTLTARYGLTETGFLADFGKWNERFAIMILAENATPIEITGKHKEVLAFLRDYFGDIRDIPTVYETCKSNNITLSELNSLFPAGYRRGACRAAGIPFFG